MPKGLKGFQKGHKVFEGVEKTWFTTERVEGKKNINWKGDKVGYFALHAWIRRKMGKAKQCEFCDKTEGTIQWANKSGKYERNLNDWLSLCASCHSKYDFDETKFVRDELGRFTKVEVMQYGK